MYHKVLECNVFGPSPPPKRLGRFACTAATALAETMSQPRSLDDAEDLLAKVQQLQYS